MPFRISCPRQAASTGTTRSPSVSREQGGSASGCVQSCERGRGPGDRVLSGELPFSQVVAFWDSREARRSRRVAPRPVQRRCAAVCSGPSCSARTSIVSVGTRDKHAHFRSTTPENIHRASVRSCAWPWGAARGLCSSRRRCEPSSPTTNDIYTVYIYSTGCATLYRVPAAGV